MANRTLRTAGRRLTVLLMLAGAVGVLGPNAFEPLQAPRSSGPETRGTAASAVPGHILPRRPSPTTQVSAKAAPSPPDPPSPIASLFRGDRSEASRDFARDGRLTEEGRARRCPAAVALLSQQEAELPVYDSCGLSTALFAQQADAAYERGCLNDGEWGALYERLDGRRWAQEHHWAALPATACPVDGWKAAALSEARACEVLLRKEGIPVDVGDGPQACGERAVVEAATAW